MGFRDRIKSITENTFRVRVIPKSSPEDNIAVTNKRDSLPEKIDEAVDSGKRIDLSGLRDLMALKTDRNEQYKAYEEMVADGRIGAAVEMYANDTVQYGPDGRIIWVESDVKDVAEYGNKLIEDLGIEQNIWSWAYCMWLYGDVYLELFENTSTLGNKPTLITEPVNHDSNYQKQVDIEGAYLERYIEKVPNPADIYDLQYKGKTSGYVKSREQLTPSYKNNMNIYSISSTQKVDILSPMKYVHVCLSPNITRFPEQFSIIKEDTDKINTDNPNVKNGNAEQVQENATYTVLRGQSMLENVYSAYQALKLKEDSILLERITKASITRIIQIELGDMPESQKDRVLRDLKEQIEQQLNMNKLTGDIQSRAGANPTENIIYTTTKNGKGVINTVNIGGEVDLGNLDDVTQSENKVYGALQANKAALGADMDGTGLSNGGSLTELNAIYARRIMRGQTALIKAVETLINIFAIKEGLTLTHVNNFTVRMVKPVTSEDTRRDELLSNKIRNVGDLLNLINDKEMVDTLPRLKIIAQLMVDYLSQQDIADVLNEIIEQKETEEEELEENPENEGSFDNISTSGGGISKPPLGGMPGGSDNAPPSLETDNAPEETPDLNTSDDIDLSNIEGQDLL
ncbi:portal protein [uncultured Clostridium sp.]|uniref:portal protein n=1 Tax=uncultured Clostridium sp. TaxID=59620 RepID=UPI0026F2D2C3|nr:portal protein [uncultured Clostridium sp.]